MAASLGQSSHQLVYICLICSDTKEYQDISAHGYSNHKMQLLIPDELLPAQISNLGHELPHLEIFSCPYCNKDHLGISNLYEHFILEHLDDAIAVRCPICVFHGRNLTRIENIPLTEHIATAHSATHEEYEGMVAILTSESDNRISLIKYVTTTLQPTFCCGTSTNTNRIETRNQRFGSAVIGMEDFIEALLRSLEIFPINCPETDATEALGTESKKNANQTTNNEPDEDSTTCSICWEPMLPESLRKLSCKHNFHTKCIEAWIRQNSTCPICRRRV
ncbi:E3 ubiquitin-protein ligase RNF130-like [Malaya genurostris]|uniref:E3 ubiquitin-protein ligase RNF130-like n=1 Tax=Malaya genurostris TaxID=325434 RepID=UPI0026F38671|nr:E3 ubiquitin-protein ligase RNF130-like [Malaya genurostris]